MDWVEVWVCPSWTELMIENLIQWWISCSMVQSPALAFSYVIDHSVLWLQRVDQFIIHLNYLTLTFISDRALSTSWSRATSENCPLWQHFPVNLAYFNRLAMLVVVRVLLCCWERSLWKYSLNRARERLKQMRRRNRRYRYKRVVTFITKCVLILHHFTSFTKCFSLFYCVRDEN